MLYWNSSCTATPSASLNDQPGRNLCLESKIQTATAFSPLTPSAWFYAFQSIIYQLERQQHSSSLSLPPSALWLGDKFSRAWKRDRKKEERSMTIIRVAREIEPKEEGKLSNSNFLREKKTLCSSLPRLMLARSERRFVMFKI